MTREQRDIVNNKVEFLEKLKLPERYWSKIEYIPLLRYALDKNRDNSIFSFEMAKRGSYCNVNIFGKKLAACFFSFAIYSNDFFLRAPFKSESGKEIVLVNRHTLKYLRNAIDVVDEREFMESVYYHFKNCLNLLKTTLFWPNYDLFLKFLKIVAREIPTTYFYELIHSVIDMIEDNNNQYDYKDIFENIWRQAPEQCKRRAISIESEKIRPTRVTPRYSTFVKDGVRFEHFYQLVRVEEEEENSPLPFLLSRLYHLRGGGGDGLLKLIVSDITNTNQRRKIVSLQGEWLKRYM